MRSARVAVMAFALVLAVACTQRAKAPVGDFVRNEQEKPLDEAIKKAAETNELMRAIVHGDLSGVRRIVLAGNDVNQNVSESDEAPVTPLLAAVVLGNDAITHELLLGGASPSTTYKGYRVMDFALLDKGRFSAVTLRLLKEAK